MLTTNLIHPEIMSALAFCGHGSKVLIADGNYPLAEKTGDAKKVYLGLVPGQPTVTQVLKAIHSAVEIEKAEVMVPGDGSTPEIPAWDAMSFTSWPGSRMWFWRSPPGRSVSSLTFCSPLDAPEL